MRCVDVCGCTSACMGVCWCVCVDVSMCMYWYVCVCVCARAFLFFSVNVSLIVWKTFDRSVFFVAIFKDRSTMGEGGEQASALSWFLLWGNGIDRSVYIQYIRCFWQRSPVCTVLRLVLWSVCDARTSLQTLFNPVTRRLLSCRRNDCFSFTSWP